MISSNQLAVAHKKHLNDSILFTEIQTFIHITGNDISVFFPIGSDLLPFTDLLNAAYQITCFSRIFKPHLIRCFLHLLSKLRDCFLKITIQKSQHFLDIFFVNTLVCMPGTWSHALFHMIIQARPVFATVSRKIAVAGAYLIKLSNQLYDIFDSPATGIRTKISILILLHPSGKQHSRVSLLYRHLDKRITFVILQHGIVLRTVFLDQVAFQNKCFQFGISNDVFKSGYVSNHLLNLRTFVAAALKILPHTVFQADCLAHINDLIPLIVHQINTRVRGKLL